MDGLTAIFLFCVFGCGATSWYYGRKSGIEATLEYLAEEGYIEIEDQSFTDESSKK